MVKLLHPLHSQEVSGSVGTTVYFALPVGNVARARVTGTPSATPKQLTQRSMVSELVDQWSNIGWLARSKWDAAAATNKLPNRFGVYRCLTGYHLWLRSQLCLFSATGDYQIDPPAVVYPPALLTVALTPQFPDGFFLSVESASAPLGQTHIDIWISIPGPASRHYQIDSASRFLVTPYTSDPIGIEFSAPGYYAMFVRLLGYGYILPGPFRRLDFDYSGT